MASPAAVAASRASRPAIETNGGVILKTIGDAFCAAWAESRVMTLEQSIAYILEQRQG